MVYVGDGQQRLCQLRVSFQTGQDARTAQQKLTSLPTPLLLYQLVCVPASLRERKSKNIEGQHLLSPFLVS